MAIRNISVTADGIIINGNRVLLFDDIPGGGNLNQRKLDKGVTILQNLIDDRILRSSLPDEDPDKFTDPQTPNTFWDGDYVVHRTHVVDGITLDNINGKILPVLRRV